MAKQTGVSCFGLKKHKMYRNNFNMLKIQLQLENQLFFHH